MRILIVEDSDKIRESVTQALREADYAVDAVADGRQGFIHAQTGDYDAVVLDLGLPELDGLSVLKKLREKKISTPVLLLTARDAIDDRVLGLQSGADDYLVKPFALDELLARVQALIRRSQGKSTPKIYVGPLMIDQVNKSASVRGRDIELTRREFALLEYLAHRAGKPVARHELEQHLYDDRSQVWSNAIDSTVCALRAKLTVAGCPPLIHTRRKVGYVLQERAKK